MTKDNMNTMRKKTKTINKKQIKFLEQKKNILNENFIEKV